MAGAPFAPRAATVRESDRVAAELRTMIVDGTLPSGVLIGEVRLSEALGCSRTPLREAVQRLAQRNLLTIVPRRGITIPPLSLDDMALAQEAVAWVGTHCAELAAARISDESLAHLDDLLLQMTEASQSGEVGHFVVLDQKFHLSIAEATGNHYLRDMYDVVSEILARYSVLAARDGTTHIEASLGEHRQLIEALRAHDGRRAAQQAKRHHRASFRRFLRNGQRRVGAERT